MKRIVVLATLAAILAAAAVVQGSQATFTAQGANGGAGFATAADWVAPAVTLTTPSGAYVTTGSPTIGGAAGSATGDASTVTLKIYAGSSATGTALQTKVVTRSSSTWSTTPSTALSPGTYTAQATQSDSAGNIGTSAARTFTVDTGSPSAGKVVAANKAGGTAGKIESGDTLTFTYSEAIQPGSVSSGWTGASPMTVHIRFTDAGNDTVQVLDTLNGATINLGSIQTNGDYVTATTTFSATMAMSADGASVIVTLGTPSNVQANPCPARNMLWTVGSGIRDLAGNVIATPASYSENDTRVDF
jgi:hypothetical protein